MNSSYNISIYRKRLIPNECILLKNDIILEANDKYILTKWNTIKPKKDLHHGFSCCYLDKGIKVSKFYREDNSLIYWYCDVVSYEWNEDKTQLTTTDLLIDILIYPDGQLKVLDLDELADAADQNLISHAQLKDSLRKADALLQEIYTGNFEKYTLPFKDL